MKLFEVISDNKDGRVSITWFSPASPLTHCLAPACIVIHSGNNPVYAASCTPTASNTPNNRVSPASPNRKCGGRIFNHPASPVIRATSAFNPGIKAAEVTAPRIAVSTRCASTPASPDHPA